jgi:hypothetical protein
MDFLVIVLLLQRLCLSVCPTPHSRRITSISTDFLFLSDDIFMDINRGQLHDQGGGHGAAIQLSHVVTSYIVSGVGMTRRI